jgi:dihydrofolate synthase/folylpolyglutamate synthase
VYTSPHLISFNERIRVKGQLISDQYLIDLLEECERANKNQKITFFEITTAAAFLAFSRSTSDITLLETGLGGKFDATNLIKKPVLTAITPISIDHVKFLGRSLETIAKEKSGILKKNVLGIISRQSANVKKILESEAKKKNVQLYREGKEWNIDTIDYPVATGAMIFRGKRFSLDLPSPNLPGIHQHVNAGTALACIENLKDFEINESAIRRGLTTVSWPGRLQKISHGPLKNILPNKFELWIDGGHNEAAGQALSHVAKTWSDKPLYLIFGMIKSKDIYTFLKPLQPYTKQLKAINIPNEESSLPAEKIVKKTKSIGIKSERCNSLKDALKQIGSDQGESGGRILICGSLYLVGHALKSNRYTID